MVIRIRLPRIPPGSLTNLIGLAGLLAVVISIGGLTGCWWWSLLSAGMVATGLAYIAQTHAVAEQAAPATARPASVPAAAAARTSAVSGTAAA